MSAISQIPPEILSSILDQLPLKALPSLRTISKAFLDHINPRLFSKIRLNISTVNYSDKVLGLLRSISILSPTISSSFFKTIRTVILYTGRNYREGELSLLIDGPSVEESLHTHLPSFLSRLENLETIELVEFCPIATSPPFFKLLLTCYK